MEVTLTVKAPEVPNGIEVRLSPEGAVCAVYFGNVALPFEATYAGKDFAEALPPFYDKIVRGWEIVSMTMDVPEAVEGVVDGDS